MKVAPKIRVCALAASILVACATGGYDNMSAEEDMVGKFKSKIGFDRVVEPGGPFSGVVAKWHLLEPAGGEWKRESMDVEPRDGGAEGEWIFKKGNETILLRVFASSAGKALARRHLIDIASATMMGDIPFKKIEPPIGTLCVGLPDAEDKTYIWFFRNICVHVRGMDTHANIEGFAKWVQSFAEKAVVEDFRPRMPQIESFTIAPQVVSIDGEFSMRCILAAAAADPSRYSFDYRFDEHALELVDEEENEASFTAFSPGETGITVQIVDHRTLLSNWTTARVKVEAEVKDEDEK